MNVRAALVVFVSAAVTAVAAVVATEAPHVVAVQLSSARMRTLVAADRVSESVTFECAGTATE